MFRGRYGWWKASWLSSDPRFETRIVTRTTSPLLTEKMQWMLSMMSAGESHGKSITKNQDYQAFSWLTKFLVDVYRMVGYPYIKVEITPFLDKKWLTEQMRVLPNTVAALQIGRVSVWITSGIFPDQTTNRTRWIANRGTSETRPSQTSYQ